MSLHKRNAAVTCSLLLLLIAGCASASRSERLAGYTMHSRIESAHTSPLALFGVPESVPGWDHGPTHFVQREGYALEHSSIDRIPLWVCEHVLAEHTRGTAERGRFKPDDQLPPEDRAELDDYRGTGYDRGHMAPAGDFKYDQDRMDDSFYLSNMVPQVGPMFNQACWRVLETRVRDCAVEDGEAWIITGPMFYDPQEDDPSTANGIIDYWRLNDRVSVPTHLFKIIVVKTGDSTYEAAAFCMGNDDYPRMNDHTYDFSPYQVTIDFVEQRTGFNFMPDLDRQNPTLANELEGTKQPLWECLRPSS